jgi:hypothetical protein
MHLGELDGHYYGGDESIFGCHSEYGSKCEIRSKKLFRSAATGRIKEAEGKPGSRPRECFEKYHTEKKYK